jgi:hypothetical protein
MKSIITIVAVILLSFADGKSQNIVQLDVYGNVNCAVTADEIIASDNGSMFTCIGNVNMTPLDLSDEERRKSDCGGDTGYICGVLAMSSSSGDITVFTCVGSSGRCLQVHTQ